MAGYDKEADEILWTSREIPYKPQASIHAEVKSYKKGEPKVTIIESGVGFRGKSYTGALLKRIDMGDIDKVITLLTEAKGPLYGFRDEWEKTKPEEKT